MPPRSSQSHTKSEWNGREEDDVKAHTEEDVVGGAAVGLVSRDRREALDSIGPLLHHVAGNGRAPLAQER